MVQASFGHRAAFYGSAVRMKLGGAFDIQDTSLKKIRPHEGAEQRKGFLMAMRKTVSIRQFEHKMFGNVRCAEIKGEPWFVGSDLAKALGYKKPANALMAHVPDKHKRLMRLDDSTGSTLQQGKTPKGGNPHFTFVDEPGMYRLVIHSRLKAADDFVEWVTKDVLPSIRKTGSYTMPEFEREFLEEFTQADHSKALTQYRNRVAGNAKRKETNAAKRDAEQWTDAQVLIAIGRRLACTMCNGSFSLGTLAMYQAVEDYGRIPLRVRQKYWQQGDGSSITSGKRALYTFIMPEEMNQVMAGLAKYCAENDVDISDIAAKRVVKAVV